jgi:hypothetical protein
MTEDEKLRKRQSILDLIAASSISYPKQGWDVVAEKTGFTRQAIEITGSNASNFVDAIATVCLTRFEAVEQFRNAKRIVTLTPLKKGSKPNAKPVLVPPAAVKPEPQPGNVVLPEPARPAVTPEARPDANRTGDTPRVAAPIGKPGGDPGVRRSVHRDKKAERVTLPEKQNSLF